MTILITGVTGFVGPYLCKEMVNSADRPTILGTGRHISAENRRWASESDVELSALDITDSSAVDEYVRRAKPSRIIHLAAISHVPTAQKFPHETWEVNCMGTMNFLEACKAHVPDAVFVYIGSGDAYGRAFRRGKLVSEDSPLLPENCYSASKAAAEILVRQYGYQGLRTVCLRAFNHVGPGQRPDFVVSAFARQIARIEAGKNEAVMSVGNLDAWRDLSDVKDITRAYRLVADAHTRVAPGSVFNVCTGKPRQIREILDELLEASDVDIRVEQDPDRLRPSDTPFAAGDPTRLHDFSGWEPRIPWSQTLLDTLNYWREEEGVDPK